MKSPLLNPHFPLARRWSVMLVEDEHMPSFLRERQSSKNARQTPPSASEMWEEGPTLLASLQCLLSHRQSGWWGHTATPAQTTIKGLFPVPRQCLYVARGNFKFTPWDGRRGSRFDLLHGAGDQPAIPRQMWACSAPLLLKALPELPFPLAPHIYTAPHRWSRT